MPCKSSKPSAWLPTSRSRVPKTTKRIATFSFFDTRCPTVGGSGRTFDWDVLQNYHGHTPFFLSGGIGPDSADRLRNFSHPAWAGVDLNSRFETAPALKDVGLLADFIKDLRGQNISEN